MEQRFNKPGFELIFGLSIILIFTLPVLIFGQNNRTIAFRIKNGDPIINGKKLRQLSEPDRTRALKKIKNQMIR
jgi:hypothetical protein